MSAAPVPWIGLVTFLVLLIGERLFELRLAARNLPTLKARGAVEFGGTHYPAVVALHALFPVALIAEVLAGARPPVWWPWLLAPIVLAEALRAASIAALGRRWHVRIWVIPGEEPVRSGIYRWLRHPNYLAVVIELAAFPLLFGAWRTAAGATAINVVLMAIRISGEDRALEWASRQAHEAGAASAGGDRLRLA